jgi:2'-phosphotransferase
MASAGRKRGQQDQALSRRLVRILRHDAVRLGLPIQTGGFVYVNKLLELPELSDYSVEDIKSVVEQDRKDRYVLKKAERGRYMIKAAQGHSISIEDPSLEEINRYEDAPTAIHGTSLRNWQQIQHEGLSRKRRAHIHFATGLPGDPRVVSGMPPSYQVAIYVDMQKVLGARPRIKFYKSANGVILTAGNENGILEPKYFLKAIDKRTGDDLLQSEGIQ